jgi:dipeptide/tripeptide permease
MLNLQKFQQHGLNFELLFIVGFARLFSKWWESKYNISGPMKFGLGLTFLGLGLDFSVWEYGY